MGLDWFLSILFLGSQRLRGKQTHGVGFASSVKTEIKIPKTNVILRRYTVENRLRRTPSWVSPRGHGGRNRGASAPLKSHQPLSHL